MSNPINPIPGVVVPASGHSTADWSSQGHTLVGDRAAAVLRLLDELSRSEIRQSTWELVALLHGSSIVRAPNLAILTEG